MEARLDSAHFLVEKDASPATAGGLNHRLLTQYIDVAEDDDSFRAACIRQVTQIVGRCITPKQMLGLLRVLKAVTLCFLTLTALADIMFIVFLEIISSQEVKELFGGTRDTIIRLYGLVLIAISVSIEIDFTRIVKRFSGLKGFVPRGLLMLFIAAITSSHPLVDDTSDEPNYKAMYYALQQQMNDDENNNNGGYGYGAYGAYGGYGASQALVSKSVDYPTTAVNFQLVASYMLAFCACGYLLCGLLCFDRFTSRAFLSTSDPRITTAIPGAVHQPPPGTAPSESITTMGDPQGGSSTDPPTYVNASAY